LLPFIWPARYIMPLSKFKKNVEYTNPFRKYNEMIGSSSDISFLVLTEPEDICKDGGLVKKILKPGDHKCQHFDDYDYVLGINKYIHYHISFFIFWILIAVIALQLTVKPQCK